MTQYLDEYQFERWLRRATPDDLRLHRDELLQAVAQLKAERTEYGAGGGLPTLELELRAGICQSEYLERTACERHAA